LGSEYEGHKAGYFGDTGIFSFHGSKTMTTGEGGMLVTDNNEIYERYLFQRDHGRVPGNTLFFNQEIAYK
jgi:perosamine synthetase